MSEKAPALVCIDGPEDDSFPVTITVRNLKGAECSITFECIPRTVTEWAAEGDKVRAQAAERIKAEKAKAKAEAKKAKNAGEQEDETADDPLVLEKLVTDRINEDVDVVFKIAKGWSVTNGFHATEIAKMEDRFPGAVRSLLNSYTRRVNGEREGN